MNQNKLRMKTNKLYALLLAGIVTPLLTVQGADLFLATLHGSCKQMGGDDKLVTTRIDNNSVIQDYIATQDPAPDPRDLKLVYDPEGDRIEIVDPTGASLSEVFSFGFVTSVADSTDSRRLRHVFLFEGGSTDAAGTAILTERVVHTGEETNNIAKITIRGNLQWARAGSDTNAAQVCTGTLSVGKKLVIRTTEEP